MSLLDLVQRYLEERGHRVFYTARGDAGTNKQLVIYRHGRPIRIMQGRPEENSYIHAPEDVVFNPNDPEFLQKLCDFLDAPPPPSNQADYVFLY